MGPHLFFTTIFAREPFLVLRYATNRHISTSLGPQGSATSLWKP